MKKIAFLVVVIIVLFILGFPPVLGMMTESQLDERVAAINTNELLAIEVQSFDRGWFTSTATIELGLSPTYIAILTAGSDENLDLLEQRLTVLVDLAHGPVVMSDGVHFGLSKTFARPDPNAANIAELQQQLGMPYLFEFRGETGYFGGTKFLADIPAIDYANELAELVFSGIQIEGTLYGNQLMVDSNTDMLELTSGPGSISAYEISLTTDSRIVSRFQAFGVSELLIDRIVVSSVLLADEPLFDARSISFNTDISESDSGALIDSTIVYGLESASVGPEFEFSNGELGIGITNVDAAAMQMYYEMIRDLTLADEVEPGVLANEMQPVIRRLLAAGPALSLDPIRFLMNDEMFAASVHLQTDPAALPPGGAFDVQDPSLWMSLLSGTADATVSKELARRLAIQVSRTQLAATGELSPDEVDAMAEAQSGLLLVALSGQGILEDQGDTYSTTLVFEDGALSLNGTLLPFGFP